MQLIFKPTRAKITTAYFIQPENDNQENTGSLTLPKRFEQKSPIPPAYKNMHRLECNDGAVPWVRLPNRLCTHQTSFHWGALYTTHTAEGQALPQLQAHLALWHVCLPLSHVPSPNLTTRDTESLMWSKHLKKWDKNRRGELTVKMMSWLCKILSHRLSYFFHLR